MSLQKNTYPIDDTLVFQTSDDSIAVTAETLTVSYRYDKPVDCILTCQISSDVYQFIDTHAWFHLQTKNRKTAPTFDMGESFEIEMRLSTVYLPMILGKGVDVQQFIDILLEASQADTAHYLLDPQNWYALYVKQRVTLPPELAKSDQFLKIGYATVWTEQSGGVLFHLVQSYFWDKGLPFERLDHFNMLHVPIKSDVGNWLMTVITLPERDEVVVYSIFPLGIPHDKQPQMLEFVTRANFGLLQGNFEYDLDIGELCCRMSLDFERDAITNGLFDALVQNNILLMRQYYTGIASILAGIDDVKQILQVIEG